MLESIQIKRERMIECGLKKGFTNVETIQYSQELDDLIYEYQCSFLKKTIKKESRKFPMKQLMLVWPKVLVKS
jgi:stage 0 sporulation regulatory protein